MLASLVGSFRQIAQDIGEGKYLEHYAVMLVALAALVFDVFVQGDPNWLTDIVLAALSVLIYGRIEDRRLAEQILEKSAGSVLLNAYPPTLDADLQRSRQLWIAGVSLNRTIHTYYSLFQKKLLSADTSIRVIVVKPDSEASLMASQRDPRPAAPRYYDEMIRTTLQHFCQLAQEAGAAVEIRTTEILVSHGYFAMDPDETRGAIYVETYGFKNEEGDIPKMVFRPSDSPWYEVFRQQLYSLWESADSWNCEST